MNTSTRSLQFISIILAIYLKYSAKFDLKPKTKVITLSYLLLWSYKADVICLTKKFLYLSKITLINAIISSF